VTLNVSNNESNATGKTDKMVNDIESILAENPDNKGDTMMMPTSRNHDGKLIRE